MRLSSFAAIASVLALGSVCDIAKAQQGGFALNQFEPSPAGDTFFAVPSPFANGHLVPRFYLMFDDAFSPIRIQPGDLAVVSSQAFLRLDASLALWDRLLVSADLPLCVAQSGDVTSFGNTTFTSLESPTLGDLRLGLRVRILGDNGGAFQLGVGSYLFAPTGSATQYTGDGAARAAFHAVAGGRVGSSVGFAWSAAIGPELTGGDAPQAINFGGAAGLLVASDHLQIGPEIYGSIPLNNTITLSSNPAEVTDAHTNAELLFGAKLRVLNGLTIGAAAGPGLFKAVGTPVARLVGMVGWAPMAQTAQAKPETHVAKEVGDKDDDGIKDDIDACPDVKGDPSPDPKKDGCPPSDRDGDQVLDIDDACPTFPGVRSADATKNGCPADADGDGVHDGIDACPSTVGVSDKDPKKNGCPADRDEDGIADGADACPKAKGPANSDPTLNGCPEDPDGDGIKYASDACPNEKGPYDPDPKQNGCPRHVRVTTDEILTSKPILFKTDGKSRRETVDPISNELLNEVRSVIESNPDIQLVEVQGHTDDDGTEEYNQQLSQERAEAVRQWLIDAGVPKEKLVAKGYGFTRPSADNRIKTGRQKNRRVQFIIIKRKR